MTIGDGSIRFGIEYRDLLSDQGVCVHVFGMQADKEVELLRFDCFDHEPHYHYGPENRNQRLMLDKTTTGEPLEWTLQQIGGNLSEMIKRAGYDDLAEKAASSDLSADIAKLGEAARSLARSGRRTVMHNRGDEIIEAGPVRFGLEYRHLSSDEGVAIHVLGDVGGEEVELLTFDCFVNAPHYHYGPRAKNQRLYLDRTVNPDSLQWALDVFKGGKLAQMLERAGYRDHASGLNPAVLAAKLPQLETSALALRKANTVS
jgi:hypothetical protein